MLRGGGECGKDEEADAVHSWVLDMGKMRQMT